MLGSTVWSETTWGQLNPCSLRTGPHTAPAPPVSQPFLPSPLGVPAESTESYNTCALQESLYFIPSLRTWRVTFLGNRWPVRPLYCSHSRGVFHLFRDNSWKTHLFDRLTSKSSSIQVTCPFPPNLQILLFLDMIFHRLFKLGLLSCSKAGNSCLSPWGEDLCDWNSSLHMADWGFSDRQN